VTDRALVGHPVALNHAAAQQICDCLASRLVSTGAAPRMMVFNEERPKLYGRFAGGWRPLRRSGTARIVAARFRFPNFICSAEVLSMIACCASHVNCSQTCEV
jgi:hypothetical protein